ALPNTNAQDAHPEHLPSAAAGSAPVGPALSTTASAGWACTPQKPPIPNKIYISLWGFLVAQRSAAFGVGQRSETSRLNSLCAIGSSFPPLGSHSAQASLGRRSPVSWFQVSGSSTCRNNDT